MLFVLHFYYFKQTGTSGAYLQRLELGAPIYIYIYIYHYIISIISYYIILYYSIIYIYIYIYTYTYLYKHLAASRGSPVARKRFMKQRTPGPVCILCVYIYMYVCMFVCIVQVGRQVGMQVCRYVCRHVGMSVCIIMIIMISILLYHNILCYRTVSQRQLDAAGAGLRALITIYFYPLIFIL